MIEIILSISDKGGIRAVHIPVDSEDTVENLAQKLTAEGGIDGQSVLEIVLDGAVFTAESRCADLILKHHALEVHRVCVEVHFETESEQHWFPSQTHWSRVHQWACKHFNVAHDACGNLELHEGTPEGAPINEREKIGHDDECRVVWLIKPGPEQNG